MWWRPRNRKWFATDRSCATWNTRFSNKRALTSINNTGYFAGTVCNKPILLHRAAWAICHDYWPELIDHVNRDRMDNRLVNIREADDRLNAFNRKIRTDNVSGIVGVTWDQRLMKYRVEFGKTYLGLATTLREANEIRNVAEREYWAYYGRD